MSVALVGVEVENLRGYSQCSLSLVRSKTLIVGRNNSGKTSILRLLDWAFNVADERVLAAEIDPSKNDLDFLLPARTTRHRARRLTFLVRIYDKRRHRRFKCEAGVARLRVNLRLTPSEKIYVAVGRPTRSERTASSQRALQLLRELRHKLAFIYVPAFRDAASDRFRGTLLGAFDRRVQSRATHTHQGGAFAEYRSVKRALAEVKGVVEGLAEPLWTEMRRHLPPGLTTDAQVAVEASEADLVAWLTSRLGLQVSTGTHDAATVPIVEVGSGLQSLLDLAIQQSEAEEAGRSLLIAVEEPESFLHPSAQRTAVRGLFEASPGNKVVVTTHSPIVVGEAQYGEVVLCRDQTFYEPAERSDRDEINTALLSGHGAEMMFSRSVLLVEGEGDRQFFEQMRRRLARQDASGRADGLVVVPVGGNESFGPWIRLLESYGTTSDRPIQWLVVADGDAATPVRKGLAAAGVALPKEAFLAIQQIPAARAVGTEEWVTAIRAFNRSATTLRPRCLLLPVDLEYVSLFQATEATVRLVNQKIGATYRDSRALLRRLGSKFEGTAEANPRKSPWIRGFLGAELPWSEVSSDLRLVLRRWLEGAMPPTAARALLAVMGRVEG